MSKPVTPRTIMRWVEAYGDARANAEWANVFGPPHALGMYQTRAADALRKIRAAVTPKKRRPLPMIERKRE